LYSCNFILGQAAVRRGLTGLLGLILLVYGSARAEDSPSFFDQWQAQWLDEHKALPAADAGPSFFDKWRLSGYVNLEGAGPKNAPASITLDDLALFVSARINRWINPFMEAEVYAVPLWIQGKGAQFNSAQLTIERLYNDFEVTESNTLRAGKFLAPINHWNLIHASPLVWTVNRPITSTASVANYITGLQARHDFDLMSGHALEVYVQPYTEFLPVAVGPNQPSYQTTFGGRWTLHEDLDYYAGFSLQYARLQNSNNTDSSHAGISFDSNWKHKYFELETEVLYTHVDNSTPLAHSADWGGYLQMAIPLFYGFHAIGRYEHFQFAYKSDAVDIGLVGLVWRPEPHYSLKLEWQQTSASANQVPGTVFDQQIQTGIFGAIAVLF
jgi:hypothetical protein